MRKNCLMGLMMCFSLLLSFGLISSQEDTQGVISVTAGSVSDVPLGTTSEIPSTQYSAIVSDKNNIMSEFLDYLGVKIFEKGTENKILNYQVFASNVVNPASKCRLLYPSGRYRKQSIGNLCSPKTNGAIKKNKPPFLVILYISRVSLKGLLQCS